MPTIIITNQHDTIAQALAPPQHPHYTLQDTEQAHATVPFLKNKHPNTPIYHLQTQEDTLIITTYDNNDDNDPMTNMLNWVQPERNNTTTISLHDPQLAQKIQQATQ